MSLGLQGRDLTLGGGVVKPNFETDAQERAVNTQLHVNGAGRAALVDWQRLGKRKRSELVRSSVFGAHQCGWRVWGEQFAE